MENRSSQIWIAVAVIVVIAGIFYYLGTESNKKELITDSIESQQAAPSPQSAAYNNAEQVADKLNQDSTLGLNCKNVAEAAAKNRQRSGVIVYVTQSNFSKNYNNCYYELNFTYTEGNSSTELHVAPNDDWIAQCTSGIYPSQLFCTAHNTFYPEFGGGISETQYKQIKAQFFNN